MKRDLKLIKLNIALLVIVFGSSCKKDDPEPSTPAPNYTNFKITSVEITSMSFLDANSTSWDLIDGPDVFFNMEDANNTVLFDGSSYRVNDVATTALPLTWNFINAYQITNTSITHYVTVYDYDTFDPNDLIGSVGFKLDDHKSGYPTTISKSNGSLTVKITGSWY